MQQSTQAANAWRVLFLLFLANLFNFFDRTIPAIINEPIRLEWNLNDFQLGLIGTAFTIVYAIAGLPLGRMADNGSRRKIMGWGLTAWSGLTRWWRCLCRRARLQSCWRSWKPSRMMRLQATSPKAVRHETPYLLPHLRPRKLRARL